MPAVSRFLKINGQAAIHPGVVFDDHTAAGYPTDFWGKSNSITNPIGKEPGVALLLMSTAGKNGINANSANSIVWSDGGAVTTFVGWYLVDARCAGVDGDSKAPWMVELRDVRQLLAGGGAINRRFNVTVPTAPGTAPDVRRYEADTIGPGGPYTWQQMFAEIWATLPGIAGPVPTLPWTPTHKPQTWVFDGVDSWDSVHRVLEACQSAIAVNPYTGVLSVVALGDAQNLATVNAGKLIIDEKPLADLHNAHSPATWVVEFPQRLFDQRSTSPVHEHEILPHKIEVASTIAGGVGKRAIQSDLFAERLLGTAAFRNIAELTTAANEIAARADLRREVAGDPFHKHLSGIVAAVPGSRVHKLIWRDFGDDDGLITEAIGELKWGMAADSDQDVVREFPKLALVELNSDSPWRSNGRARYRDATAVRYFPDVDEYFPNPLEEELTVWDVRKTEYAVWNDQSERWEKIGGSTGRVGFIMTGPRLRLRHSDQTRYGTATARVTWIAGDVPVNVGDSIIVSFPGAYRLEAVKNCEGFADYFTSYSVPPSEENPSGIVNEDIYAVTACQGLPFQVAAITLEDRNRLTPDQDVLAYAVESYGQAQNDLPIELWEGQAQAGGCSGNAVWRSDQAGGPPFTLITPCSPGCHSQIDPNDLFWLSVVIPQFDYESPCVGDGQESPQFYLRFPQLKFPRSKEGAEVLAKLDNAYESDDPADMRYIVDVAQELPDMIRGTLPDIVCGTDFSVASISTDSDWPHNQAIPANMLPLLIRNAPGANGTHHAGIAGDIFTARWNVTLQNYYCDDIQKKEIETMTDHQVNIVDGCFYETMVKRNLNVESCDPGELVILRQYTLAPINSVTGVAINPNQSGSGSGAQCTPTLDLAVDKYIAQVECGSPTPDVIQGDLDITTVVVGFTTVDNCKYPVFAQIITGGQCGDNAQGSVLFCIAPCPEESGSGQ